MHPLIKPFLLVTFWLAQNSSASDGDIRKDWEIKDGKCRDCVDIDEDDPGAYFDFAIYKDRLYLCDYISNRIRIFEKGNKNTRNIPLSARPELLTEIQSDLYVLLWDGTIVTYDLEHDTLYSKKSIGKVSDADYSNSFIIDSLLAIPISNGRIAEIIPALVVNIKYILSAMFMGKKWQFHSHWFICYAMSFIFVPHTSFSKLSWEGSSA